jgi:hypothetical protein
MSSRPSATHRRLAIALCPQLITLITRSADPPSYWSCSGSTSSCAFVQHGITLAARSCSKRTVGVRQAVRLDEALARRQDMAILMELQCVLRAMGQCIERRRPHMLRSKVVLMLHWWRKLLVLVESCRHHPSSAGLGHNCTARQQRIGLNGGGVAINPKWNKTNGGR